MGDWKLAKLMPIYKKIGRKIPGNYRPISLTSELGKVMDGAGDLECHYTAHPGQPGNQAQPALVHEKQVLLDQPDLIL